MKNRKVKKMAAKKSNSSKEGFVEFEMKGKNFDYSGRLYPANKREAGKLSIVPMSLCLNGVFTVKGCSFYETSKNVWVGGPQYQSGKEYKDFLYMDKEMNEDMDNLAAYISELLSK